MELPKLLQELSQSHEGAILEVRGFGRHHETSIWVDSSRVEGIARELRFHPKFSWEEALGLTAFEMAGNLALSVFLRDKQTSKLLLLRWSLPLVNETDPVVTVAMSEFWPMLQCYERELSALYGILFQGTTQPTTWSYIQTIEGYPLRKSFQVPKLIQGYPHFRSTNHSFEGPAS
jgi:NADH:ubiquinone oxidoreductase subunit C